MIELHLIGYTADLGRLVLDLAGTDGGRYRLVVDADLFATIDELREERRAAGLPVGDLVEFADELGLDPERARHIDRQDAEAAAAAGHVSAGAAAAAHLLETSPPTDWPPLRDRDDGDDRRDGLVARFMDERRVEPTRDLAPEPDPVPEPVLEPAPEPELESAREPDPAPAPAPELDPRPVDREPPPALAVPPRPDADRRRPPRPLEVTASRPAAVDGPGRAVAPSPNGDGPDTVPSEPVQATLSPAEIQTRLRHGRSVRSVAREAGVDEAWIRRWEAPILAEQARVRDRALAVRTQRARLGTSSQPLGAAVAQNLGARGVDTEDLAWDVSRRRDGRWRVAVRYVSRGRKRSATWTYDPDADTVTAASDLARDLGFTRRRR